MHLRKEPGACKQDERRQQSRPLVPEKLIHEKIKSNKPGKAYRKGVVVERQGNVRKLIAAAEHIVPEQQKGKRIVGGYAVVPVGVHAYPAYTGFSELIYYLGIL